MRPAISCLPGLLFGLALAGCDRQKAAAPQGASGAAAAATPAARRAGRCLSDRPARPLAPGRSGARRRCSRTARASRSGSSAFRGRPVLVNLWATWCGPCVVEMPSLDALAARAGAGARDPRRSARTIDGRQKVTDFFAAHRFQRLEPYLDPQMRLMSALGLDTLPTTILYDSAGPRGLADDRHGRLAKRARR